MKVARYSRINQNGRRIVVEEELHQCSKNADISEAKTFLSEKWNAMNGTGNSVEVIELFDAPEKKAAPAWLTRHEARRFDARAKFEENRHEF